jgi:hypothetical protein
MSDTVSRVVGDSAEEEILRAVLSDGRDMDERASWLGYTPGPSA